MILRVFTRSGSLGLLILAALACTGCGSNEKPSGAVSGKVTYNGNPVAAGNVNFLSTNGVGAQAKITSGTYKIDGTLVAGEYSVYVNPPQPEPQPPGSAPMPPVAFDVPKKFQDANSSGTKVTIKAGKNDVPVEFKD